jgi:hypothetical protein
MQMPDDHTPPGDAGLRPIGNHLRMIAHSPPSSDSTQPPSPTSSGTTGVGQVSPWRTGQQLSAIDAENSRRAVVESPTEREATENLDRLCERLLGSLPAWQRVHRYGPDGQHETEISGVVFGPCASWTIAAWKELVPLCEPASRDAKACQHIAADVARLFAVTPAGRTTLGNEELAVDTIAMELAEYPADCALRALRSARLGDRWRPSLSQLIDDVRWRSQRRAVLREAFLKAGVA